MQRSGGPGSGVYLTKDGGAKWTKMTNGMPKSAVGKIDVQIAPSDSKRMYALIQTADQGSVWRSDDAGTTWKVVSWDRSLIGRAGYYIRMVVNPQNPDDIFIMRSSMHRSQDGGKNFSGNGGTVRLHAGTGELRRLPRRLDRSEGSEALHHRGRRRRARSTRRTVRRASGFPNGQMYHVHVDNRVPVLDLQQPAGRRDDARAVDELGDDRATAACPRTARCRRRRRFGRGRGGGGGGGGRGRGARGGAGGSRVRAAPGADAPRRRPRGSRTSAAASRASPFPIPTNADIVYASCYGNKVTRWDARTGTARSIQPWMVSLDSPPNETKYRCHWTSPMAIDPFDTKNVLYGCQLILKTSNGGQSWTEFSPDLSTKDPSRIVSNGGLVGDNLGQYNGEVVWSIEYSKIQRGLIWAGTNDGKLWNTQDDGAQVERPDRRTSRICRCGARSTRSGRRRSIPATAYVAVSFHLMDDRKPYIYKTTDFGATWTKINGNIPTGHPLDYVLSMSGNPNRKGMLFAGTGRAFYYSMDDGGTWTQFKNGLPPAPVSWITVEPRFHDVVISTYGRGLYILPNITLLEQTGQPAPPRAGDDEAVRAGADLPPGAQRLPAGQPAALPARARRRRRPAPMKMEILDASGKVREDADGRRRTPG